MHHRPAVDSYVQRRGYDDAAGDPDMKAKSTGLSRSV